MAALAAFRRDPEVRVVADGAYAWVVWGETGAGVRERVLALPGSNVYERREGQWFERGRRLPSFGLPVDRADGLPLASAVIPEPLRSAPEAAPRGMDGVGLELVNDGRPRETSALRCRLGALAGWVEWATTAQLGRIRAAVCGEEVLLTGRSLPAIAGAFRYWGVDVLAPLGFRPEPALGEAALREVLGVAEGDLLVLGGGGFETVPRAVLRPLSRAGVRLARAREGRPV
jgi:hypothetical protein